MTAILDFYNGKEAEGCNHRLPDAWEYPYARHEREHDLIQWLFPLNEPSDHNPDAPILTDEDIKEFRTSDVLRWRVLTSVHTFMKFLHFNKAWLSRRDHNQLRITRMLKFLTLINMGFYANALHEELMIIIDAVPGSRELMGTAISYWDDALKNTRVGY